jgi:hypothetical protein
MKTGFERKKLNWVTSSHLANGQDYIGRILFEWICLCIFIYSQGMVSTILLRKINIKQDNTFPTTISTTYQTNMAGMLQG